MSLNIQDLANIVAVINHAATILNHTGLVKKDQRRSFETKVSELQSLFVDGVQNLNTSSLSADKEHDNYLTIVKIGDDSYRPTESDLQKWKEVFEQAQTDKDFAVFTHPSINVERVNMGKSFPAATLKVVGFSEYTADEKEQLSLNFNNENSGSTGFIKYGDNAPINSVFDGYGRPQDVNDDNIALVPEELGSDDALKEIEEKELKEIEERVAKAKKEVSSKKKRNPSIKRASQDD